jgi:hypothetical protein
MIGMPATPGNENIAQRRTRGFNEIRLFSEEPCDAMREAGMQLLDGLQRLESVDRRFQTRSRMAESHNNENSREDRATAAGVANEQR